MAARTGELEKLRRYDETVVPLALETYGRLGPRSEIGLRQIATSLASSSTMSNFKYGKDLLAYWRCDVERTLLWNMADIVLLSFGHSTGVNAIRRGHSQV